MVPTRKRRAARSNSDPNAEVCSTVKDKPLGANELRKIEAYWRAANYLSVGQIYLYDNPLLKKSLSKEHI
jgi:xylulose-5-phosphate/fructose-6-phosphate phosphoketolase